ncbi:uncharacterized protein LOC115835051 [Nomascus leucogenys]|uniref:uncharacterized protein LOC115835051 n=1 Tax=Nomascus leucogenys TaxID=61853 RepID=UPI00122DA196|nr:uncharacterized protein LOC115835051 [Nomascus leucogenys]
MQGLENRKSNSSPLVLPYPLHGNFDTRLNFLLENPERPQSVTCVRQDLPFLVNTVFLLASSGWQWYCPTLLATPEVPSVTPNSAEGLHLLKKLMPSLNPLMTEPKDSLVCAKRPGGCVEGLKGKKITILLSPLLTVKFNIRTSSRTLEGPHSHHSLYSFHAQCLQMVPGIPAFFCLRASNSQGLGTFPRLKTVLSLSVCLSVDVPKE